MDSALVCFATNDGSGCIFVYVPRDFTFENAALALQALRPIKSGNEREFLGSAVADFAAAILPAVKCRVIFPYAPVKDYDSAATKYTISYSTLTNKLMVFVRCQNNGEAIFDGSVEAFAKWVQKDLGLIRKYKDKLVRFKYNGGSKPGKDRWVKVNDIREKDRELHICGIDLEKPDIAKAYRQYAMGKIDGEILILN